MAKESQKTQTINTAEIFLPQGSYRLAQLQPHTGLGKSTIWKLIARGRFPRPSKLGYRTSVFSGAEILKYLEDPAGYRAPAPIPDEVIAARPPQRQPKIREQQAETQKDPRATAIARAKAMLAGGGE